MRPLNAGQSAGRSARPPLGAREARTGGAYTVDEAAQRHSAGVERETTDPAEAYARFPKSELTRYREGWLPE
jgi:hypothetical protein